MNLRLPSRIEAWQRLQKADPDAWVLRHCRAVEGLAVAMADRAVAQGLRVDADLVARGALLHDIGRAETHDHATPTLAPTCSARTPSRKRWRWSWSATRAPA